MRTSRAFWSVCPLAVFTVAIVFGSLVSQAPAQVGQRLRHMGQPMHQGVSTGRADQADTGTKASELIGMKVRGLSADESIGSIDDLVISQDGRVKYAAVSFGGFAGIGDKLFAVPFEAIAFDKDGNDTIARIDVTEETLKQKQGFNQDKWPTEADRTFRNGNLRRQTSTPGVSR